MARRVRHPLVSLAMFLVVCSMAYVVFENRHMLKREKVGQLLDQMTRDDVQDKVFETFENDGCFRGLRSNLSWRPNENRYRLDIEVEDGEDCENKAKALCEMIAHLIQDEAGVVATVAAYDAAGREVGRCVL